MDRTAGAASGDASFVVRSSGTGASGTGACVLVVPVTVIASGPEPPSIVASGNSFSGAVTGTSSVANSASVAAPSLVVAAIAGPVPKAPSSTQTVVSAVTSFAEATTAAFTSGFTVSELSSTGSVARLASDPPCFVVTVSGIPITEGVGIKVL